MGTGNNKKLKVTFLYECRYRNDGSPLYLKTNMMWNLEKLNLAEVKHFIPGDEGKADLFIWIDHGEDALKVKPHVCPKPNVYWCSDSHLGMDYRLKKAEEFDWVFLSIKDHIPIFKNHLGHDRVYWLPHAGEPTAYAKQYSAKKYDVSFIGHVGDVYRRELLEMLFRQTDNFFYGQRFFESAADIIGKSKIAFNHAIAREVNMRSFEIPMTGTPMLTTNSFELEELGFKDDVNCILYDSIEELAEKFRRYIYDEEALKRIGEAGYQLAISKHTYLHRAETMLNTVRKGGLECLQ